MRRRQAFQAHIEPELIEFAAHEGRDYIVAPCIAIVPGVLNNALVPMHAIENTYRAWNGRPIVVNHPQDLDGNAISANEPDVIESVGIGQIWYANTEQNRLQVQAWINLEKAEALGGEAQLLVQRLQRKEPIELSTGYWGVMHEQRGIYNDQEYGEITDLITPDHLAFYPNAVGGWNWGGGCGVPRFNESADAESGDLHLTTQSLDDAPSLYETVRRAVTHALRKQPAESTPIIQMTVSDQFAILAGLICKEMEAEGVDMWRWHILDIENETVIMQMDGKLVRRPFTITDSDDIELSGEWEEVNRKTTFTPAMSTLCDCAQPKPQQPQQPTQQEEPPVSEPMEQIDTLAAFLAEQGVTQEDVQAALQARNQAREQAITKIVEHAQIDRTELTRMSDHALQALAKTYEPVLAVADDPPVAAIPGNVMEPADFSGRGQPVVPNRNSGVPERPRVLRAARKTA